MSCVFGKVYLPFGYVGAFVDIQVKFTEIVPREPSVWELNTRGVAEYSDFSPIECYLRNGAR